MRPPAPLVALFIGLYLFVSSAFAFRSGEHLELTQVESKVDEYGLVVFDVAFQNTHAMQAIDGIWIYVVLKKEGRIVAIYQGIGGRLVSGGSASFSIPTEYAPEEYDDFEVRLEGQLSVPELELVEGELVVVEESLNLTTHVVELIDTEYTVFYGEILNNTNAIVNDIQVKFDLLGSRDSVIGTASTSFDIALPGLASFLKYVTLQPGEKIDFAALSIISISRIKGWTVEVSFKPVQIVDSMAIPTVSADATWGQIKHSIGGGE